MIYTSLSEIASFKPCSSGWRDILKGQKKTGPDDVLFPLAEAVKSNSIADVCWLLGERKKELQVCVKFARMCADSVKHLNTEYSRKATATAAATATAYAYAAATAYATAYAAAADAYAAAAYAASAATAAASAASASAATDAASAAAYYKQKELNKSFLIQCITEWNEDHNTQEIYVKLGAL